MIASAILAQPGDAPNQPLRSVHTRAFPCLLEELGASLLVSTYAVPESLRHSARPWA